MCIKRRDICDSRENLTPNSNTNRLLLPRTSFQINTQHNISMLLDERHAIKPEILKQKTKDR